MTATPTRTTAGVLELTGLRKIYGAEPVVRDVDLTVAGGEFFTILGPSGSGKTTTLMMIAGFTDVTSGTIALDGADVSRTPPEARNMGVVFQNYMLFPHMTVAENLAFPLQMRRVPRAEANDQIRRILGLVQLSAMADKYPAQLSGGQQQRIAVARAVVFNPAVLLMDEPLGALDRRLRAHMQTELRQLQRRLEVTVVSVTHDQEEAMSMSDRIGVMNQGRLEQVGRPEELYNNPASLFVAQFLGENNLLNLPLAGEPGSATLPNGATAPCSSSSPEAASAVIGAIRPERITINAAHNGFALPGTVADAEFLGSNTMYQIAVDGIGTLRVAANNDGHTRIKIAGDAVQLSWRGEDLRLFPA